MKDHTLNDLWKDCQTILEQIGIAIDIPEAETFETCLAQLNELDRKSIAFRYPVTKSSVPTLPSNLDSIDVENLRMVMDRMDFFLDEIIRDEILLRRGDYP